jgi:hypothetical protein
MTCWEARAAILVALGLTLGVAPHAIAQDPLHPLPSDSVAPADSLPPEPILPGLASATSGGSTWPWLIVLPGWHGFGAEHYNRVDGLAPSWGVSLDPVDPDRRPALAFRLSAATTRSRLYWSASIRQRLPLPGAVVLDVGHVHRTTTFDDWKISVRENDVATFLAASDLLDWWREKGFYVGIDAETADGRLGAAIEYFDARQYAEPDRSPFSLFDGDYRENPPADEGTLRSLSATVRLDTRDVQSPLLPSPGWWVQAEAELAGGVLGGDLDFRRAAVDLRRFTRLGTDTWWDWRAVWMGPLDGDSLPAQRHVMLGGPGSLRGFRAASLVDSEGLQLSTETRVPLPVGRRIALLFLSWHWVAFVDAGTVGDYERWHADVGTGIAGINLFSFVELVMAQRVTDFDREGSGPRFVVRFRRDL